jgi:Kelch motif/Galactose oxidase, central domain
MNLPSLTRAAFASGFLTFLLALPALAVTPPPPHLHIKQTTLKLPPTESGAAAALNNQVYYAGGTVPGGTVTNALTDVDGFKHTVTALTGMPTARTGLGLTAAFSGTASGGNVLYAIGGTNGTSVLGTNEVYDVATGTWTSLAPMPTPRAYLTVVAGTDGFIYAIGGVNAAGQTVNTVEIYNPTYGTWRTGPSLLTARSHAAATLIYDDIILVAGGQDVNGTVLNTTEGYVLQLGAWTPGASMNTPRADFGIALGGDGYVHAVGGRSTTGSVKTFEALKFSTNTWIMETEKLPFTLSGVAVAEGLSGAVFVLGGAHGTTLEGRIVRASPPFEPTHSVTYYVHGFDVPWVLGSYAMDEIPPLQGFGTTIALFASTNFTSFPDIGGTIESGGNITVSIPATILVGLINGLSVEAENLDGSDPVVIGTFSSLLGLSGDIVVPINAPLSLNNKVLVLNISTILGVDLELGSGYLTVTLNGLDGKTLNPQ